MKNICRGTLLLIGCMVLILGSTGTICAGEKISVLDLKPLNVDKVISKILAEHIRDQIYDQGVYEVMSKEDVYAIVDRVQCIQEIGAETDTQCVIDAARELGTRYMVVGTLSKLGETYSIHLRLLDTGGKTPGVKRRVSRDCRCPEDELIATARLSADDLMLRTHEVNSQQQKTKLLISPHSQEGRNGTGGTSVPADKRNEPEKDRKNPFVAQPGTESVQPDEAGTEPLQNGRLMIDTMKDKAEVYVVSAADSWFAPSMGDEGWKLVAVTPADPVELEPGDYWVRIRFLKGVADEDVQEVTIKPGKTKVHRVLLEQSTTSGGAGGGL